MMGSEDFSYFLKEVPGAFAWIGNGKSASLHNPKYDFNDNILSTGAEAIVNYVSKMWSKFSFFHLWEI